MTTIRLDRHIDRPRDQVFDLLDDFGGIHRFYALVERSPTHAGAPTHGLGAERTCHFYDGHHIDERVVDVVPGSSMTVDIYDGSMPIRTCVVRFDLADEGAGTRVTITADYELKFGFLGKMMDTLAVNKQFTHNLTMMLAGIDHHLATGQLIEKGWQPVAA